MKKQEVIKRALLQSMIGSLHATTSGYNNACDIKTRQVIILANNADDKTVELVDYHNKNIARRLAQIEEQRKWQQ